jgi:NADH-quinone oxidoreductase E subunit
MQMARSIICKYPSANSRSAILPLLHLAQKQNGNYLTPEAVSYVANLLNLPEIKVQEVASFYSMFNMKPVGQMLIQICGTTSCMLRGCEKIMDTCCKKLKIKPGETTKDNKFTVMWVECLGACANAPVMQVNDVYFEDLNEKHVEQIIDNLEAGKEVKAGSQIGRRSAENEEIVSKLF